MRLDIILEGKLTEYLENEYKKGAEAVTKGITEATIQFKETMRNQVKSAKLGTKLANTWRGDIYPKSKNSIKTAGMIYTKAEKIMHSFEYGQIIQGKDGFWLAIPTPAIPRKIAGKKVTPALYEKMKSIKLRYIYRPNGTAFLVHDLKRRTIIAFWLVKQVKMPKLINFIDESQKIGNLLPSLILKNWRDNE